MPDPFAGFTDQGPNAPPQNGGDPFAGFTDNGPGKPVAHDDRTVWEKLTGSRGERYQLWPERLVRGLASDIADAATLPGEVYQGKVDPMSPEGMARARGMASLVAPGAEVAGTGAQIARRALTPGIDNPIFKAGRQAAEIANDIGAPLPRGVASDSPGVRAVTQSSRQLPFVGEKIGEQLSDTAAAAGERVGNIAEELSRGPVEERAVVGARTRTALENAIEKNNDDIDALYDNLRQNHIIPQQYARIPETRAAIERIQASRQKAGLSQTSGLEDTLNLLTSGRGFDGLVRARNQIGQGLETSKFNANPGFNKGDMKLLYGAMSRDLDNVVRSTVRPGVNPDDAAAAFHLANDTAKDTIERNGRLSALLRIQKDEPLIGGIVNMANNMRGSAATLGELRSQMSKEDFEAISGLALSELGIRPGSPEFNINTFARNYAKMSPSAKQILFSDAGHRKALDDIATLGKYLESQQRYMNTSNTGRATMTGVLAAEAGQAITEPHKILGILGTIGGGYTLANILAKPMTAKRLAALVNRGPSIPRATAERLVRGLVTELQGVPGFDPEEASQAFQNAPRQPVSGITVTLPKAQDRVAPGRGF